MQLVVNNTESAVFEGKTEKGHAAPLDVGGFALGTIYPGKAVLSSSLVLGNLGLVLANGAAALIQGVAVNNISKPGVDANAYARFTTGDPVTVRRKGGVWVRLESALTSLNNKVWVRTSVAGGTPPVASLGSFYTSNVSGQCVEWVGPRWIAYTNQNGVHYGLLSLDMPYNKVDVPLLVSVVVTAAGGADSVAMGRTLQLTATEHYDDESTIDVTSTVTWTSEDEANATVSAGGLVTGVDDIAAITITATGDMVGTIDLEVTPAELVSIAVTSAGNAVSVAMGLTLQLTATGTYTDGTTADLTATTVWDSANDTNATVSASGLVTGVAAIGALAITATTSAIVGTKSLAITAAVLVSIAVTSAGAAVSVAEGATLQLTATGTKSDGTTEDLSATATWASADETKATVSVAGLVTGVAAVAAVNITATRTAIIGTKALAVTAP